MHAKWRCKYHMVFDQNSADRFSMARKKDHRRNIAEIMWVEGREHSRSGMLSRPYSYVAWDVSKNECIGVYLTPLAAFLSFSHLLLFPAFSLQSHFLFLHPRVAQSGNGFRPRLAVLGKPRRAMWGVCRGVLCGTASQVSFVFADSLLWRMILRHLQSCMSLLCRWRIMEGSGVTVETFQLWFAVFVFDKDDGRVRYFPS